MSKLTFFLTLNLCFISLECIQAQDEPLSKQPWSRFGPLSQYYVAGRKEKPEAVYTILKNYVNSHATILDLGSGTGISTRQLFNNGFKNVIGVDRDPLMIKEANAANHKGYLIKYIQADISNDLPFLDEQFDVVTASSAFHWFANPSSIKEVACLLKPEGYYFVIGSASRYRDDLSTESLSMEVKRIFEELGVLLKPKRETPSPTEALKQQGFKIIVETLIPYQQEYTKQEYLNRLQSLSSWNLVKEFQRGQVLRKISQYLDTILDEQGKITREGFVSVVLAQKTKKKISYNTKGK